MTADAAHNPTENWRGRLKCWALVTLLLLCATPDSWTRSVNTLSVPVNTVLARQDAWNPPLVRIESVSQLAAWPYWLYAVGMGVVLSILPIGRFAGTQDWVIVSLVAALGLLVRPADLIPMFLFAAATSLLRRPAWSHTQRIVVLAFAIILSLLLCIDFTVLILCLLGVSASRLWGRDTRRSVLALVALTVVGIAIGGFLSAGFRAAAWRPLSWLEVPAEILPLNPFATDDWREVLPVGLMVLLLPRIWYVAWHAEHLNRGALLMTTALAALGLTCGHYSGFALATLVCLPLDGKSEATALLSDQVRGRVAVGCLLPLCVLYAIPNWVSYRAVLLAGQERRRLVDPSSWKTSGRVLLMNLDESSLWNAGPFCKRFQLVADDRWDAHLESYPLYAQVCRDLREMRSSRYLQTDGTWGGYKFWIDQWKPGLVSVDSRDAAAIRRLSVSPHLRVMGVDSLRTIFGAHQSPPNQSQFRVAGRLLADLEWPSTDFEGRFEGVVAARNSDERRRVAEALLAMRLPYAAMRVMSSTTTNEDELLRARARFEIAHRIYQQTRAHSLLDQYRAIAALRMALKEGSLAPRRVLRIARGLEVLKEFGAARQFAGTLSNSISREVSKEAGRLVERCRSRLAQAEREPQPVDGEGRMRLALRAGDREAAEAALETLDPASKPFYGWLVESSRAGPRESSERLVRLINAGRIPENRRSEALFYLGDLAVEIGDSKGAMQAYATSVQADPRSPFNSLSRFSIGKLR